MELHRPETLDAALALLAEDERRVPLAGGTDLMVRWPQQADAHEKSYVDTTQLRDVAAIEWTQTELRLGGTATFWDVIRDRRVGEEFPLLVAAAREVGGLQIQTRGTWAGNIANASPAADGVAVLMAYDAVVELASSGGSQDVPLAELSLGYKRLRRRPDQLIRCIRVPRTPPGSRRFERFEKVGSRAAQTITKVGLALVHADDGWRVVANSVAPTVCRCPHLEALLDARAPLEAPADLRDAIRADVSPIDDIRSSAAYRETVLARVLFHTLRGD